MKIVHLCNYIQPKLGYQEFYLAKEHQRLGHQVWVIASDRYYPFPNYDETVASLLGPRFLKADLDEEHGFPIVRLRTILEIGTKPFIKGLRKTIVDISPDLVICHGMDNFNSFRIARIKKNQPFRLYVDDHSIFSTPLSAARKVYFSLIPYEWIIRRADRLIAVSDPIVGFMEHFYRVPPNRIELIPLGADTELFKFSQEDRTRTRADHEIEDPDFVVIYTGKIIKEKGIHYLVEALGTLKVPMNKVLFVIGGGDPGYQSLLIRLAEQRSVRLILHGSMAPKSLPQFYSASDVAVWPQGVSIGTIEAMSCSLPVICEQKLKERYQAGNGFGVQPGDVDSLRDKLYLLAGNRALIENMGQKSRRVVEEEFSWNVIARKFL